MVRLLAAGRKLPLLCTVLLLLSQAQGQKHAPATVSIPYTPTLWRASDGLPEDTVQALLEDTSGALWVGTTGGFASFDGSRVHVYPSSVTQAMGVNSIFCLAQASDGSVWMGAEGGGLLHLAAGKMQVFGPAQGLSDGFVRSILADTRGRLWVGTDRGLFVLSGDRLKRIDGTAAVPEMSVHSIAEDRDGRVWVGGSRLIAFAANGAVEQYTLPGAYSENRVKRILETSDGTVWVGTVGGLQRSENGHFAKLPGISATVRSLLQTADGTLWIGTIGDGLWVFRRGQLARLQGRGVLPSETVLSILQDRSGQIWVGTQAGLVRLNRTPITVVPLPGSGDPDFETIAGDTVGHVWVAANKLYEVHEGVAHQVSFPALGGISIRNVFRARDGALWIGTDGGGAFRLQGTHLRHFSAPQELTNNFVRAFLESRNGDIWIATDEGVNRVTAAGVLKLNEQSGLSQFSTRCLTQASDGSIWIGTDRGVSHWVGDRFRQDDVTRALIHEKVWSVLEDRRGDLWFGTRDHGLFRYRAGRMEQYTTEQGLPVNSIYEVLEDRRGWLWLTGADTIASMGSPAEASPAHPPSVRVYDMPYGSGGAQMYGGRQPAGFLATDGSVWFPTSRGAAHIAPGSEPITGPAPMAVVDSVSVDGQLQNANPELKLPAHALRLSFAYSAVYLRPQKQIRFRYRLENFDRDWTLTNAAGTAIYTNLPAGKHRFQVQAFDTSHPEDVSEAEVLLIKAPLFYQSVWFYLACAPVLAAVAWAIYWVRLRQIRVRFAAVLHERSRLAREMHDTVIQGCTGVSALLEAVASTAPGNPAGSAELLDYAREQTRLTINAARQAVWNMRHEPENDVDLVEGLRVIASQMAREYGRIVTIRCDQSSLMLRSSAAHEVLMTVREAVYNAVQHSGGERISLETHLDRGELALRIEDDGRGFAAEHMQGLEDGHFGIQGMRERMQRLGGSFELRTQPGSGTIVRLVLQQRSTLTTIGRS